MADQLAKFGLVLSSLAQCLGVHQAFDLVCHMNSNFGSLQIATWALCIAKKSCKQCDLAWVTNQEQWHLWHRMLIGLSFVIEKRFQQIVLITLHLHKITFLSLHILLNARTLVWCNIYYCKYQMVLDNKRRQTS